MIWPRFLIAAPLLALPIWAGAASRSLWLLPVLILVFALAFIDGKNRIWRENFAAGGLALKAKATLGALMSQCVLVSILFFGAAGVSAAFGALEDRAPFDRLDAGLAAAVLALCLLGGALTRWAEGGRDVMDRALEQLAEAAERLPGEEGAKLREMGGRAAAQGHETDIDADRDADFGANPERDLAKSASRSAAPGLETLIEEAEALDARKLIGEMEIDSLARRIAARRALEAAETALALAAPGETPDTAPHRRLVGLRSLLMQAQADAPLGPHLPQIQNRALEALAPGAPSALRLEAFKLVEALGLGGDALRAATEAVLREEARGEEPLGEALRRRAGLTLERLERLEAP